MSLLLSLRTTVQGGSGTILLLTTAFGTPLAARQPAWFGAPDELAPIAQESEWLPPAPQSASAPRAWALVDDDFVPASMVEDEPYLPLVRQPSYQRIVLVGTQAPGSFAAVGNPEDDSYLPLIRQPQYQRRLLASSSAVATPPTVVVNPTDEWHYQQFLPPPAPIVLFGPWSYGVAEDTASLLVAEDQWQPRVVWPDYRRVLLAGGMAPHPAVAIGPPIDEHPWSLPLVAPVSVTLFGPWSYGVAEDTIPLLQGDEGLWLPPLVTPRAWSRLVLTLSEESAAHLGVQEDYDIATVLRARQVRWPVALVLPVWLTDPHDQGFGLVVPSVVIPEPPGGQVIPRYLWERGPHLWIPGFRRG